MSSSRPSVTPVSSPSDSKPKQGPARRNLGSGIGPAVLVAITLLAYLPALNGQLVWDDDSWTTNIIHLLRDMSGLRAMWCNLTALQQYFPLSGTTFWIDYQLWGFWTLPYHVENVLLHALAALLIWRLLARLEFPAPWMVAAIFALHPVMVESAAWITERKNVLSLALYLGALLAYGRFNGFWATARGSTNSPVAALPYKRKEAPDPGPVPQRRRLSYGLALLLFLAAMLAKTTAFSLPPVLLLLSWWKRGRLRWRADLAPALPFFAAAIGLGLATSWVERHHVGAGGAEWAISFPERCLIAGRALWFYAGKLLWPINLCFVYPRWQLHNGSLGHWLFPAGAFLVILLPGWTRARIGRGPLTAVLFFVGTISPLLGFINGYFMRYSFVCDHWAYLPDLGLITLSVGLLAHIARQMKIPRLVPLVAVLLLPFLAVLTWRQAGTYRDMETLWRRTLATNPGATMAHINLGNLLLRQGHPDEAVVEFQSALEQQPRSVDALSNLGPALLSLGRIEEAISYLRQAIEIQPNAANAHNNLGNALAQKGQSAEALVEFQRAVELAPGVEGAHFNLGTALLRAGKVKEAIAALQAELALQSSRGEVWASLGEAFLTDGRVEDAIKALQRAVQLQPGLAGAYHNLGNALLRKDHTDEAESCFRRALQLQPDLAPAHVGLGNVMLRKGSLAEAEAQFHEALALRPDLADAHFNLAGILLQKGNTEPAVAEFQQALAIEPNFAPARNNLGTALLSLGRIDEAIAQLNQAVQSDPRLAEAHNNLANAFFRKGQPKQAVAEYEAALALQAGNPQLLNNLAWALATCPEDSVRNGARSVDLAQKAVQLTGNSNPQILGTLAAAWAEAGKFPEAIATAQQALERATAQTNATQVEALRSRLALYESGKAFRDQELGKR